MTFSVRKGKQSVIVFPSAVFKASVLIKFFKKDSLFLDIEDDEVVLCKSICPIYFHINQS